MSELEKQQSLVAARVEALFEYLDKHPELWRKRVADGQDWTTLVDPVLVEQEIADRSVLAQVIGQDCDPTTKDDIAWAIEHAELAPHTLEPAEQVFYYQDLNSTVYHMLIARGAKTLKR